MNRAKLVNKREKRAALDKEIERLELEEMVNRAATFIVNCRPAGKPDVCLQHVKIELPSELKILKRTIMGILAKRGKNNVLRNQ